jgi:hypothetical protein
VDFLSEVWQPTSGDIERTRLVELARHYLELAGNDPDEPLIEAQSD